MRHSPDTHRPLDSVVLLFLFALLIFLSPLTWWWASDHSPWYLPYLLWTGLIVVVAWYQRRRGYHDL
jgi:hypothetical protein